MCTLLSHTVYAIDLNKSDANIIGHVLEKKTGEHLPYMTVALKGTTIGTMTDGTGHYFLKNLPEGEFILSVSAVGYKPQERKVTLKRGKTLEENFELEEDMVALDGVVVTANRNETARRLAPTLVKVVTPKLFDMTNSHTLSQGLVFQPGVRVENDCQNCGYSQVRINGMDGKYTQNIDRFPPYLLCIGRCLRSGTNSRQHDRACGSGAWRWLGPIRFFRHCRNREYHHERTSPQLRFVCPLHLQFQWLRFV